MDAKTKAIVAHLTIIGWVIAFMSNKDPKDSLASFYLRQVLGIMIVGVVGSYATRFIPGVGSIVSMVFSIVVLALWIMSLLGAINEKETELPVVGAYFQDWFKNF